MKAVLVLAVCSSLFQQPAKLYRSPAGNEPVELLRVAERLREAAEARDMAALTRLSAGSVMIGSQRVPRSEIGGAVRAVWGDLPTFWQELVAATSLGGVLLPSRDRFVVPFTAGPFARVGYGWCVAGDAVVVRSSASSEAGGAGLLSHDLVRFENSDTPGWLSVTLEGGRGFVQASECAKGESLRIEIALIDGVWVISTITSGP